MKRASAATGTPSSGGRPWRASVKRHIPAEEDELALADIDDVHDAPDQRHAIGGQREDRADEQAIDQKLERQRRRLDQDRNVIHGMSLPSADLLFPHPRGGGPGWG